MFNLTLKFVTPIRVKAIDRVLEQMLKSIDGDMQIPFVTREIENTLSITNAMKIPSKATIAQIASTLNQSTRETFDNDRNVNVEVVGNTKFVGITSIEEV